MSKILYSITRGYCLDSSDMSEEEIKGFIERIENNEALIINGESEEELGKVVHFEGLAWKEYVERITGKKL